MTVYEVQKPTTLEDVIAIMDLMAITLEEGHPFVKEHPHLVEEVASPMETEDEMDILSPGEGGA